MKKKKNKKMFQRKGAKKEKPKDFPLSQRTIKQQTIILTVNPIFNFLLSVNLNNAAIPLKIK